MHRRHRTSQSQGSVRSPSPGRTRGVAIAVLTTGIVFSACFHDAMDIPTDPEALNEELIRTVQHGNHRRLRALIEAGADVTRRDLSGWTPLHFAVNRFIHAGYEDLRSLEVLLETPGVDVNSQGNQGATPIQLAAAHGNVEVLELLLRHGADLAYREGDELTALASALRGKKLEMAKHLLRKGVAVDERLPGGGTALYMAIRSRDPGAVSLLLEAGATVDPGPPAAAPIIYAASMRSEEILRLLIDAGADVNAVNPRNGLTPLHRAIESGPGVVKLLLDAGANPRVSDIDGRTPLDVAREIEHREMIALLEAALS